MAVQKGTSVIWSVDGITATGIVGSGIEQSFSRSVSSAQKEIMGDDGECKTLICREPAKYSHVVQSLKEGRGVIQIAVEQGMSKSTVQTIREKNRGILPCWKRRTAKALGDAGVALAESIASGHEKIPWNQKALSLGILLSKKAEL